MTVNRVSSRLVGYVFPELILKKDQGVNVLSRHREIRKGLLRKCHGSGWPTHHLRPAGGVESSCVLS